MAKLIPKVYGEALFEMAAEEGKELALMEEAETLLEILKENPELSKVMLHPEIPREEKLQLIEKIFRGRISEELTGFLEAIVEKERYGEVSAILAFFIDEVKEEQGIGVAYVASALPLTDGQKEEVKKHLLETTGYRKMEMHYQTDPALIGGMVIRIRDRVMDSSIRTRLDNLTKQLLKIQKGASKS
jgi:ATP synthase F1, delta subunit